MKWLIATALANKKIPKWLRIMVCATYILWFVGSVFIFAVGCIELYRGNASFNDIMTFWCKCFLE